MSSFSRRFYVFIFLLFIAGIQVACLSGSGTSSSSSGSSDTTVTRGSTDVAALTISSQVTLTEAKESDVAGSRNASFLSKFLSALDDSEGTDYAKRETHVYSFHNSQESLEMANEIMCMLGQTRYEEFVNAGPYVALVDSEKCSEEDHSSDSSDQSSSEATQLERWVVDVIRTDNDSPQQVSLWINSEDSDDPFSTIHGKIFIEEAASEESPLGIFEAHFQGLDTEGNSTMTGVLAVDENSAGENTIQMLFEEASGSFAMEVNAIMDPATDSGRAYASQTFSFGGEFEDETADAGDDDFAEDEDFDDDEFEEELSSNAEEEESEEMEGFSMQESALVAYDADHYLARQTFGDEDPFESCLARNEFDEYAWGYALFNEDGSLVERNSGMSVRPAGSSDDEGHNFCWAGYYGLWCPEDVSLENGAEFQDDDDNTYTFFRGQGRLVQDVRQFTTLGELAGERFSHWDDLTGVNYFVEYSDGAIMRVATESCGETGCQQTEITPEPIELAPNAWIGMWKEGFGHVDITADENGQINDDMEVPYYINTVMTPGDFDGPLELRCYQNCLKGGLTVADLDNNDPYLENQEESGSEGYIYSFDPSDYSLSYNDEEISIETGAELSPESFFSWGVNSGRMVTSDISLENPWEIWSQDVTYVWEIGPDTWNTFQGIKDSNDEFVQFDRPLKCEYHHEDYGTFLLDYSGEGELQGIPWTQVEDAEAEWEVWRPQFSLANGEALNCEGTTMYVKARDVEQNMREVDVEDCAELSLPEDLSTPDLTYEDPDIGEEPTAYNGAPLAVRVTSGALVE